MALLIQATGSFNTERGARNALLKLSPEAKKLGVVATSAGNHALALAYHGAKLGIPVTVVMPSVRACDAQRAARSRVLFWLLSAPVAETGEVQE